MKVSLPRLLFDRDMRVTSLVTDKYGTTSQLWLENDIFQVDKSDNSMSYLERYFAQAKNDKAVQWMKERYDKVKKYYNPFENAQSVNVAVFMGLILPEAETGFREGL